MSQSKDLIRQKNGVILSEVNLFDQNGNRVALTSPFNKSTQNFMEAEAFFEAWSNE
jgi:hypothetical protein